MADLLDGNIVHPLVNGARAILIPISLFLAVLTFSRWIKTKSSLMFWSFAGDASICYWNTLHMIVSLNYHRSLYNWGEQLYLVIPIVLFSIARIGYVYALFYSKR